MNSFKNTDIDQGRLVAMLRSGDRKAIELLYDQYASSVYGVAFIVTKNESEAEKILKETFLNAWKDHSSFNETCQDLKLWLIGIARRIAQAQISFDEFLKNHADVNYVSTTRNDVTGNTMTALQKKVFELIFFGGGKINEVARHLSMDEQNIRRLLHEAVYQYRKELEQA